MRAAARRRLGASIVVIAALSLELVATPSAADSPAPLSVLSQPIQDAYISGPVLGYRSAGVDTPLVFIPGAPWQH
jgi:hypothetical protein